MTSMDHSEQPDLIDVTHASGAECYRKALELVGDARRLRRNLIDLDSDAQRDQAEHRAETRTAEAQVYATLAQAAAVIETLEREDPQTGAPYNYPAWDGAVRASDR